MKESQESGSLSVTSESIDIVKSSKVFVVSSRRDVSRLAESRESGHLGTTSESNDVVRTSKDSVVMSSGGDVNMNGVTEPRGEREKRGPVDQTRPSISETTSKAVESTQASCTKTT